MKINQNSVAKALLVTILFTGAGATVNAATKQTRTSVVTETTSARQTKGTLYRITTIDGTGTTELTDGNTTTQ